MKSFAVASLAMAFLLSPAQAAVSIGPAGSGVITFSTLPGVTNWSTRALAGADTTYATVAALDAAVNGSTNAASTINTPLVDFSPTNPPAQHALASWTSAGTAYVQTRPTGVGATELMASLQNDSGSNVTALSLSYVLGTGGTVRAEQVASHQFYYNLSGVAGSWTKVAALSDAAAGNVSAMVPIPGGWAAGARAYLLWVDDNATNGTDTAWTLDNVSVGAVVGTVPLSLTLTSPTNAEVFTSSSLNPANVPLAGSVVGTTAATNVAFFTNGVLALGDSTAPYSGTAALPIGTHKVHARAQNGIETVYSATNTITVRDEFIHYSGGTLTENFNSMGIGTQTPLGWYVGTAPPVNDVAVTVGTGSAGASSTIMGWNFGNGTGDSDRSLGTAATTTDRNIEVRIVNNSGQTIRACDIRYDGEVWRNYTNSLGGWLSNLVSVDFGATWVHTGFNFEQPATTPRTQPQAAVNGRDSANRTAGIGGALILPAPVAPGGVIYIRWHDFNDSGVTDGGLAINNFTFTAIPGNAAPVLLATPDCTADVGTQIVVTNRASDSDVPAQQLTFTLASPAPAGATLSSNGVFRWRPLATDAGTTNLISVCVRDDGVPSLSATQSFKMMVRDYAAPSIGTFIVRAGDTGAVPIRIFSSAGLASLNFTLLYPPGFLTNLGLRALAPQVATADFQEISAGTILVRMTNYPGQVLQGTQQVALLAFSANAGQHSAFVPISIANIQAVRADGTSVPDTAVQSGRMVVIGNEPLLEATTRTNNQRAVTIYGKAGSTYVVESAPSMSASQTWQAEGQVVLPDMSSTLDVLLRSGPIFYRAREQ